MRTNCVDAAQSGEKNINDSPEYCLITGATGGLGGEFAKQILERGERLFLTGRSAEKLDALKAKLLSSAPDADIRVFPCDMTDSASRERLYAFFDSENIRFDKLINVAGADTQLPFAKYDERRIVFQCRVNLEGTLSVTHAVLDRRGKALKILTISSMSGSTPMPYFALYSATKSALKSFFSAIRLELGHLGVSITVAMPGGIPTRDDIIKDIERQGFTGKLSSKPKDFVVRKCLTALEKGKKNVIPGAFNKFVYFTTRLAPQGASMRYIAKRWSNKEKDAF